MRNCDTCNTPIPQERLDVLPNTTTCVKCSRATVPLGFMISAFSKGTAPELVLVRQDGPDDGCRTLTRAASVLADDLHGSVYTKRGRDVWPDEVVRREPPLPPPLLDGEGKKKLVVTAWSRRGFVTCSLCDISERIYFILLGTASGCQVLALIFLSRFLLQSRLYNELANCWPTTMQASKPG